MHQWRMCCCEVVAAVKGNSTTERRIQNKLLGDNVENKVVFDQSYKLRNPISEPLHGNYWAVYPPRNRPLGTLLKREINVTNGSKGGRVVDVLNENQTLVRW